MIALDASVAVKWFKPHERFEAEAQSLLNLIGGFKVEALASEWLSLEVVRGLKRAQQKVPALAISDEDIHAAYEAIETLFRSGALLEVPVSEVKTLTKNAEIALGLYAADALHLATAIYLGSRWLVTDDGHLLSVPVQEYARKAETMTAQPEWLIEKEITLSDGTTALWSYDTEGDMLEIFFNQGAATCTVELADGVLLRLDLEQTRPLSLAFLSFTPLTQRREFGPPLLRLDGLDDLPDDIRQTVLQIITSPPVNAILKVFSYAPTLEADRVEPLALLDQPIAMPI